MSKWKEKNVGLETVGLLVVGKWLLKTAEGPCRLLLSLAILGLFQVENEHIDDFILLYN